MTLASWWADVSYVNELIARLTNMPVRNNTQTNRPSTVTHPSLKRTVYTDFSHDNQMFAIHGAIGIWKQRKDLDPTKLNDGRTWITSNLVPFLAQMVMERLDCEVDDGRGAWEPCTQSVYLLIFSLWHVVYVAECCAGTTNLSTFQSLSMDQFLQTWTLVLQTVEKCQPLMLR